MITSGLLFVDKPAGMTSHDVVSVVRRAARSKRVGHAGTLDPFATGLLVLAVNSATRLLPHVVGEPKVYDAVIRFGHETDTDDRTGEVTREAMGPAAEVLAECATTPLREAIATLTGHLAQVPPAFSAKHVNGERAYAIARRGDVVELPPVDVLVMGWEWLASTSDALTVRITCGGGTYIRALARDLGRALGSAAHCESLRRVASGAAHVADAITLEQLEPGSILDGRVLLRPPLSALGAIAHESLDEAGLAALRVGRRIPATTPGDRGALLWQDTVVAIAERVAGDWWQPRVVMLGDEAAS
ncbi:tRNA pseudouridine(55) synthase TruB [Gemmatimonas sp.]|uniref:tRNA pseudouridine(55) synthase TruB n=1 Tax=Gemmatimonas sp. TaxID=1962908 RepID=UPI00286DEF55|nr:tRNA pseudouridine(55) synthase TruB [Gemmatimonas sp.]